MEITFQAKIATVKPTECIQDYCTNPKEDVVKYVEYKPPPVSIKLDEIIEDSIKVLNSVTLNTDKLFVESSQPFQPKKKSSKLISIMKDIQTTTLQAGNINSFLTQTQHTILLIYFNQMWLLILIYLNKILFDFVTGIYGGNKSVLLHIIQLECLKKYCDDLVSMFPLSSFYYI